MAALRAGDQLLDAAALVDDEAESNGDSAAQAVRRRRRVSELDAVDLLATAVGGAHGDGDLAHSLKRQLVALRRLVGVGGLDDDRRPVLRGRGRDRRFRDAVAGDSLVLGQGRGRTPRTRRPQW